MNISTNQFLTFLIENERFAFEVLRVVEVIEVPEITRLPSQSVYVEGVINLRGSVIPVVDLRLKFGLPHKDHDIDSAIIIVEVEHEGSPLLIGSLVDSVKQVIRLNDNEIEPVPKIGVNIKRELVHAIAKKDDELIVILSVDTLFSKIEIELAQEGIREKDGE